MEGGRYRGKEVSASLGSSGGHPILGFSMISAHLQRAHRQQLASQCALLCFHHYCYRAQTASLLLIQSHRLACSVPLERALTACSWDWPRIPSFLNSLMADVPTKPLQPTLTGQTFVFQPRCFTSTASSEYLHQADLAANKDVFQVC